MNRKNIYLIAAILSAFVFIGYLSETKPVDILGVTVPIIIVQIAWLLLTLSNAFRYMKLRKEG